MTAKSSVKQKCWILVLRTQLQLSLKRFHNLTLAVEPFQLQTVLDANTDDQDMEEVRLSPKGRALLSLIEEMEDEFTNSDQGTTLYECESEIMSRAMDQSETVHQSETGYQSETVDKSKTLCEAVNPTGAAEQSENDDVFNQRTVSFPDNDPSKPESVKLSWKVFKTAKKSGRPKIKRAERKKETLEELRQTNRLVDAVANGDTPSLSILEEAVTNGATYKFALAMRARSIIQTKRAKITVIHREKKQPTPTKNVMTVLPRQRIDACEVQVALFQNRWFSDHEHRISQQDVTVVTGRTAYDVKTLKAMRSWHTAVSHFDIIDEAIKWVEDFDSCQWQPREAVWAEGILEKDDICKGLKNVDVLGDFFWATSLCGKTMIEGPCLDTAVKAIVKRNSDKIIVFSIPSDVLRFPNFHVESIKHQVVWKDLKNARASMDLDKDRLLFFAAINYGLNHWCAVTVDFNSNEVKVYDPQQAGDRFKQLRAYLKSELLSRLPQLESPKRFRFTRCQWLTQLDNYNCGVFVLMFFELCILGYDFAPSDLEGKISPAMQFYRYRYLSQRIIAM
ncbi:Ulp1 protease family C-terminal catalytic domain-containing protein [Phytophthora infestans]|uniref:Ulp1 protease family C-terminal catalytic domain-containing protein n=1 Tax=Phytophthora infestans TaxID=4787 RepID=A0A8S9TUC0_PHYIN|nr:Ulp1 protease family C-terminal catalytic domain-containing protein [Phytophthora infestans]